MARAPVTRTLRPALLQELEAAKLEHQQGRYDEARRRYKRLLKRKPEFTQALHFLGVLEHMDGNSELGLSLVQRACEQSPDDYDIRKNLGNILNDLNRGEAAEVMCRELVAERPADSSNHSNHSVALRKLGRFVEAAAAARQALELAPDNAMARLALANALACAGDLHQAVQAYEQVIALKPAFSPAHNSLCQVLLQIEQSGFISRYRLRRTRQAYRRWVQAVPGDPTAKFMLDVLEQRQVPERMPDAAVKASFDAYADRFDKHLRALHYRGPELIAEVLARRLPPAAADLDILDGGCGTGLAATMLRPYARRLTGIDLSAVMLGHARAGALYDQLLETELGSFLEQHPESCDVCVIIDVLEYFGDLNTVLRAASRALRPGGLLAFTVEKSKRPGSHLHPTGRYSHHPDHVQSALAAAGMVAIQHEDAQIRSESNTPVIGLIVSAQRPA